MRLPLKLTSPAFVLALVATACGGGATASPAPSVAASTAPSAAALPNAAVGQTSTKLADGSILGLPTGTLYINVLSVPQPPSSPITHAHVAGIVYSVVGTHQLAIQDGATTDIKPGQAGFVGANVAHTHSNLGATPIEWYFTALRPVAGRTATPLFPGQAVLFESADLPQMTAGKYLQQLNLVSLEKGGRTAAHKHGGLETIVVTEGTVQLRTSGGAPVTLTKGKGITLAANTPLQAINTGDATAKFLAFFVTLEGEAFSTNVETAP